MSQPEEKENLIETNKKKSTKKKKKNKRCCVCRKKNWTNMSCECGEICCITHLKRELHKCKIERSPVNKEYMITESVTPKKISVI